MQKTEFNADPWSELKAELDAWAASSIEAALWWRDDDAIDDTPALRTLTNLSSETPIALAVIPEPAVETLAARLADHAAVSVLQHGFAHRNHAPEDEKKSEYGQHRPASEISDEIKRGHERLRKLFGQSFQPIFVPPWNRIDDRLIPLLSNSEFHAISTFGCEKPQISLPQINAHIDIIDWRGTRGFVGDDIALGLLIDQLSKRRQNKCHSTKAIGVLTHHLDHDKEAWRFLERLLEVTSRHAACRWMAVETLLEQTQ